VHRVLFTLNLPYLGPVDIYTYGVMMVLAFLFALTWALKFTKPRDIEPETVLDLSIYVLIGGIIGARLVFVLMNYDLFTDNFWGIFNLRKGGLAWYGAVIAGIIAGLIFSRRHKISFWKLADIFAAPIIIGLAIGRIGCFFNGCCYGTPTDLPWGVVFPEVVYDAGIARHPTQIYESIMNIIIFYALNVIDKKKTFQGETFCCFIGLYGVVRFIIEFFREWTSVATPPVMGLNLAQITSIVLVAGAIIVARKLSQTDKISSEEPRDKTKETIGTELKEYMEKTDDKENDSPDGDKKDNSPDREDINDEIM